MIHMIHMCRYNRCHPTTTHTTLTILVKMDALKKYRIKILILLCFLFIELRKWYNKSSAILE